MPGKRYLTELGDEVIVRLVETKVGRQEGTETMFNLLIIQPGVETDNFITDTTEIFLGSKMVKQLAEFLNDHVGVSSDR